MHNSVVSKKAAFWLKNAVKGFSASKATLFMFLLMAGPAFAQVTGIAQLGDGIEIEIASLKAVVITIGFSVVGLAVVVGTVFFFKGLGKSGVR